MKKKLLYIYLALLCLAIIIFHKPILSVTKESVLWGKELVQCPETYPSEKVPAINQDDFSKDSAHLIGKSLLNINKRGGKQKSLELLYRAVAKDPNNPLPHFVIAQVYLSNSSTYWLYDTTPAILHLKKAIQLDPTNGYLHHCLAEAYFKGFGQAKIKNVLTEIKAGNESSHYNMYESEMARAIYDSQKDDWLTEFTRRNNVFYLFIDSLLNAKRIANTLVSEGERLRQNGDVQKALEYFAETLKYGERQVKYSKTLISQMIGVAIKEIARIPLCKVYQIENNSAGARQLGIDFLKDDCLSRNCCAYSGRFLDYYNLWLDGHSISFVILLGIFLGLILLLLARLIYGQSPKEGIGITLTIICVVSYFVFWLIAASILEEQSKYHYWHSWHFYQVVLLVCLPFLLVLLTYLVISYLRFWVLKKKGISVPKWNLAGFSAILGWILIIIPLIYLATIPFNYRSENYIKDSINVADFNEVPKELQVTDEKAKAVLEEYLQKADSILAKIEPNKKWNDEEREILRALLYAQDDRCIEKILPKLEVICDYSQFSFDWFITENYYPAILPEAKKLLVTKGIRNGYDWKLFVIGESGDRDSIEPLKQIYNDWAKKQLPDNYARENARRTNIGALTGIALTLYQLGEKQFLYDLIETSYEPLDLMRTETLASITTDEKIRKQVIKYMEEGKLLDTLWIATGASGVNIPFQTREEMEKLVALWGKQIKSRGEHDFFDTLKDLANEQAIESLTVLLNDKNKAESVNGRIIFALGELGARQAIPLIKENLSSTSDASIRCNALYALSKLISKQELNPLLEKHQNDNDFYVRQAVWQLRNLDSSGED